MPSFLALATLMGVALLALFPSGALLPPEARLPEKVALLFLLATWMLALWPPLHRRLIENRDATTWLLISTFFVLFHLGERAGPLEGWSLRNGALPDDAFVVSYALRLAVLGAIASLPAWIRGGGPQKALWAALGLVGLLGGGSFYFLARFYKVGAVETLDPTPLPTLFLQIAGYGAIAALCCAVTKSPAALKLATRAMPLVLLAVWAKMQFVQVVVPEEDA